MEVGEFLKLAARSKAYHHCSTDPADWCVVLGYVDFAWKWRSELSDADCESAARDDGLVALWDIGIDGILSIAETPYIAGDIAVVTKLNYESGAIFTGERWAIRSGNDIVYIPIGSVTVVKAWRP